jgi:hypothetical protein
MTANTSREVLADDTTAPVLELGADLSPAVRSIEAAYRMIQRRHADVPNVTIVVKRDARAWGHTTVAKVWSSAKSENAERLEIMISGENLARGAQAVAGTLLHEAAHARNLANGILDTDVNGRHNRKFRDSAELLGLTVENMGRLGWTATNLSDESAKAWRQLVSTIERGLAKSAKAAVPALVITPPAGTPAGGFTRGPGITTVIGPRKRTGNRNLLKAECGCGASIRLSQTVLDLCQPTCQVCDQPFKVGG